ncbi:unnamed protein product, partial [Phaeothamnion confervicola]
VLRSAAASVLVATPSLGAATLRRTASGLFTAILAAAEWPVGGDGVLIEVFAAAEAAAGSLGGAAARPLAVPLLPLLLSHAAAVVNAASVPRRASTGAGAARGSGSGSRRKQSRRAASEPHDDDAESSSAAAATAGGLPAEAVAAALRCTAALLVSCEPFLPLASRLPVEALMHSGLRLLALSPGGFGRRGFAAAGGFGFVGGAPLVCRDAHVAAAFIALAQSCLLAPLADGTRSGLLPLSIAAFRVTAGSRSQAVAGPSRTALAVAAAILEPRAVPLQLPPAVTGQRLEPWLAECGTRDGAGNGGGGGGGAADSSGCTKCEARRREGLSGANGEGVAGHTVGNGILYGNGHAAMHFATAEPKDSGGYRNGVAATAPRTEVDASAFTMLRQAAAAPEVAAIGRLADFGVATAFAASEASCEEEAAAEDEESPPAVKRRRVAAQSAGLGGNAEAASAASHGGGSWHGLKVGEASSGGDGGGGGGGRAGPSAGAQPVARTTAANPTDADVAAAAIAAAETTVAAEPPAAAAPGSRGDACAIG